VVVMGKVHRPERYGPEGSLDTARLKTELEQQGKTVFLAGSNPDNYPGDIVGFLESNLQQDDVVLMLTNGSFAGLKKALTESFQKNGEGLNILRMKVYLHSYFLHCILYAHVHQVFFRQHI